MLSEVSKYLEYWAINIEIEENVLRLGLT
jgi:hypothetical protein